MCLLYVIFGGGCKPLTNPNFGDRYRLLHACRLWFNVTCKGVARPLRAYMAVSWQIHCNRSSYHCDRYIVDECFFRIDPLDNDEQFRMIESLRLRSHRELTVPQHQVTKAFFLNAQQAASGTGYVAPEAATAPIAGLVP